jgi:3-oxoacyl-[acyl-carrier-protein] synthase-3
MTKEFKSTGMKRWGVRIAGSGGYLPGIPISNSELILRYSLDSNDEWIQDNLGIKQRHFASEGEAASDLGAKAAMLALENAGIDSLQLDRIILASSTADWISPAAASNIQRLIGATCPAEDKQVACASFIFALDHGARLIATGLNYVLIIASEVKSRFVRTDDLRLAPIFADGAAAFVLTRSDFNEGLLQCEIWTDGQMVNNMITPAGGSAMPASHYTVDQHLHSTRMNVPGRQIFNDAVDHMTDLAKQVCIQQGIDPAEVDFLIPHQANLSIMKNVAARLHIPEEKVIETISETGNIVSATIPYSYYKASELKLIEPGNLILMVTVGAGYSGGAALYREPEH